MAFWKFKRKDRADAEVPGTRRAADQRVSRETSSDIAGDNGPAVLSSSGERDTTDARTTEARTTEDRTTEARTTEVGNTKAGSGRSGASKAGATAETKAARAGKTKQEASGTGASKAGASKDAQARVSTTKAKKSAGSGGGARAGSSPKSRPKPRGGNGGPARVIAVANQKGGVGKSTTSVNLSACLGEKGQRVLLVDIDPQANATSGLGLDHTTQEGVYEVLVGGTNLVDVVLETEFENVSVAPSSLQLAGAEVELVAVMSREGRLLKALEAIIDEYDFILIDCPPSLGLLTLNGLTAAAEVIVPIQCEYYALEGVTKLNETVGLVRANLNPRLRISGVLLTMFDARTRLSEQVAAEVRNFFDDTVFRTVVPRSVRLSEAPSHGLPINVYHPNSPGADAYRTLAEEVIARG